MKFSRYLWNAVMFVMALFWSTSTAGKQSKQHEMNKLESLVVRKQRFSTQFIFDFSSMPKCKSHAIAKKNLFELEFYDIEQDGFDVQNVAKKLSSLSLVSGVSVSSDKGPNRVVRVSLKIDPEEVFVRVSKYNELRQVVLDIFSKRILEKLVEKKSKFIEMASAAPPGFTVIEPKKDSRNVASLDCFMCDSVGRDRVLVVSADSGIERLVGGRGSGRGSNRLMLNVVAKTKLALQDEGFHPFCMRDQRGESIADHVKFAQQIGARMLVALDNGCKNHSVITSRIMLCNIVENPQVKLLKWDSLDFRHKTMSGLVKDTALDIASEAKRMRDSQSSIASAHLHCPFGECFMRSKTEHHGFTRG